MVNFEMIYIILGETQCFEERPEGRPERKASVPMMMDGRQKIPVCRNVASFAEAYKRRKEFMTDLNNRIK